jgi:hypothetical protein
MAMASGALTECSAVRRSLMFLCTLAATNAFAEDGLVIDAASHGPISGAFIVTEWRGRAFTPVHSHSGCYHVELTRSGQDGSYHVDLLSGNYNPLITDRIRTVSIFKPGYEIKFLDQTIEKQTVLQRFTGSFHERLRQYRSIWVNDCPDAGARLRSLLEAISGEAQNLAQSPEEREKAAYYQLQLDIDSIGDEAAHRKYEETVRSIKHSEAK